VVEPNSLDLADSNSSDSNSSDSNCLDCPESNSLESDSLGSYSFDSPESNSSNSNSSNSCQCVSYESSSRLCLLRTGQSCALSDSITSASVSTTCFCSPVPGIHNPQTSSASSWLQDPTLPSKLAACPSVLWRVVPFNSHYATGSASIS
jgi:hypothetical protein